MCLAASAFHSFVWYRLPALRARDSCIRRWHPAKGGLAKKSFALIDHLRSVDKRRQERFR